MAKVKWTSAIKIKDRNSTQAVKSETYVAEAAEGKGTGVTGVATPTAVDEDAEEVEGVTEA
jgi:hypothetical protein